MFGDDEQRLDEGVPLQSGALFLGLPEGQVQIPRIQLEGVELVVRHYLHEKCAIHVWTGICGICGLAYVKAHTVSIIYVGQHLFGVA